MNGKYLDDAFEIDDSTSAQELIEYAEGRVQEPIEIDGTTIYNFSSHPVDREALEEAVQNKLKRDMFVIPLQVTGAWTFLATILPQRLREADILIYRTEIEEYFAYKNFNREISDENRSRIKQNFAQEVDINGNDR